MTPDRRNRQMHGPFSTWQWAVLGAYLAVAVMSAVLWAYTSNVDKNTQRVNGAICAEIHYLEKVINSSTNPEAATALAGLVGELRQLNPRCPQIEF